MPAASWAGDVVPPRPSVTASLTLRECYALALKQSEDIAVQQELIKETEGRFLQAVSGVLPRASFSSSDTRQDASGESAFKLQHVPLRKFTFSQPLFAGFKEFAAMAGSRAERRQRTYEKARAEQLLFTDVSQAFYLLLEQREDRRALEAIRLTLMGRIEDLQERERLGRSRPSEVVSAEAQLRRIEAEREGVQSQETTARQLLEFLTGLDGLEAVSDTETLPEELESEDAYLATSASRPDVRAAEERWRVARQQVAIERAKFWPTVDVESNYYVKRVGNSEGVDWDALLKIEVPIFQGGQALGATKEAGALARQAKWQLQKAERTASLDIRDKYAQLQAALATQRAFEKALEAAEDNYRLQTEDYRRSLVNNLEVLQALQALEDARRDLVHATYEAKRLYWQLQVATGKTG